jgi:nucleoside-diphosphate-sugar epimerase
MKILVTGATGFVGSHLVDELLASGRNQVVALVRDSGQKARALRGDVTVVRGDLFASEPFPADIEQVFHLAAVTKIVSRSEFTRVNGEGTRSLLEKLRPLKNLRKVVLLSSLAAAGPNRRSASLREDMPAEPISLYGKSKLAQEELFSAACPVP